MMFSFFIRTPKVNVDCFTSDPSAFAYTPIVKASKTIPEWWKKLPPSQYIFNWDDKENPRGGHVNMRNCQGFLDFYKRGAVVENWSDIQIKTTHDDIAYYYSYGTAPTPHNRSQYGTGFKDYHHLKLNSPWILSEKTGIEFLYTAATWAQEDYHFRIVPGVLNFRSNHATNVNMLIPAVNNEFTIPVGLPLTHIIPLTEKNVTFTNHIVTDQELRKINHNPNVSFKGWKPSLSLLNRNKERKGKCPFGFGD